MSRIVRTSLITSTIVAIIAMAYLSATQFTTNDASSASNNSTLAKETNRELAPSASVVKTYEGRNYANVMREVRAKYPNMPVTYSTSNGETVFIQSNWRVSKAIISDGVLTLSLVRI